MGWTPFYPAVRPVQPGRRRRGPRRRTRDRRLRRRATGLGRAEARRHRSGRPARTGRGCSTVWRANLLGSSSKGNEYFLRHLLGTTSNLQAQPTPEALRPNDVAWTDDIPEGKLDLLMSIDFRMTSTTLLSDVVLPAATWYEKADLSSTDMHPYRARVQPGDRPAVGNPVGLSRRSAPSPGRSARWPREHLGTRTDVVLGTLQHDTPGAMAYPGGTEHDWRVTGETPVPGKTMGPIAVVDRDYAGARRQVGDAGPAGGHAGRDHQGRHRRIPTRRSSELAAKFGVMDSRRRRRAARRSTPPSGWPTPSWRCPGTSNGRLAVEGFRQLETAHRPAGWYTWPRAARNGASPTPTPRPGRCR